MDWLYGLRREDLYELSQDELINYVVELWTDISKLERDLKNAEQKLSDKIEKDFEDNRKMVGRIFSKFVNKNKGEKNETQI